MRRFILIFIVIALLAGFLAWGMQQTSSYLLISVGTYSVEMSLWTGLIILFLVYLLLRLLSWLGRSFLRAGKGVISTDWFYRVRRDRMRTSQGFSHYLQGQWQQAQRNLLRGAKFSDTPALNYLGAAIAAHELGDKQLAGKHIQQAEAVADSEDVVTIVKARLYLQDGDFKSALLILQQFYKKYPRNSYVLPLLVEARKGLGDWDGLKGMLPELKRYKIYDNEAFQTLQRQVYVQLLSNVTSSEGSTVTQLWQEAPGTVKKDSATIAAYVSSLLSNESAKGEAEKLLHRAIKNQWNDRLVALYGEVVGEDPMKQLKTAEAWLETHKDNANLLFTLGKLSLRNQLWGKAKDYLTRSLAIEPRKEVYATLAPLLEQLGETMKSTEAYQKGLMLAVGEG